MFNTVLAFQSTSIWLKVGEICLSVKQLGSRWDTKLLGITSGSKLFAYTVNLGYNELGYKESSAIRNIFETPESSPSLFYMKKYGYNELGYTEFSDIVNTIF